MGLMRKRFAQWTSGKLHRLEDALHRVIPRINKWGSQGHMECPLCGRRCHMDNIDSEESLCFDCSPTPDFLKRPGGMPDAYAIPYGDTFVIQGITAEALEELKRCASTFVGARLTGGGMLYPADRGQVQHAIGVLRRKSLDVELKRYA